MVWKLFPKKTKNLILIKKNISDIDTVNLSGYYAVIHLANIANDPAALLDARLTWDVNVLFTKKVIEQSIKYKLKIYFC